MDGNETRISWLKKERLFLQQKLTEELNGEPEYTEDELKHHIEKGVLKRGEQVYLSVAEKKQLGREIFHALRGLDVLSDLLEDEEITEIMINGNAYIFIEKHGVIEKYEKCFPSEDRLRAVIQQIVSGCNRIVNETNPIVDARLPDGSRVNVVLPPIALDGAVVTIRKFPKEMFTMDMLIQGGSITREAANFLKKLVKARYNLFISGGTGSGKTTLLNVLSGCIPKGERVITIEDSAELRLSGIENLVRLETRDANVEGEHAISMSQLIKTALRMRPERIIVGEVRDAAAMDMINSMLTGHDGSISTGHGNSAKEMLLRLETMILMGYDMPVLAIRQQVAAAIDVIIHVARLRDGSRRVLEINEVMGIEAGEIVLNELYRFQETGGQTLIEGMLKRVGSLQDKRKLQQKGMEKEG